MLKRLTEAFGFGVLCAGFLFFLSLFTLTLTAVVVHAIFNTTWVLPVSLLVAMIGLFAGMATAWVAK